MNIFFYTIIFIMGITFGSFYTLAVYRIPKKQDITHTHSYCPNCNHKLGFLDLIPVFSYIFLGAKCRYCKEPIRIRYLLLEVLSGISFLLLAISMKLNIFSSLYVWIKFTFTILNFIGIFIIIGIYNQYKKLNIPVMIYLFIISLIYNLLVNFNIINISLIVVLFALLFYYAKSKKYKVVCEILLSCVYFFTFYENIVIYSTIILCFFTYLIVLLFCMIKNKSLKKFAKNYFLTSLLISNILATIVTNFYRRWIL